MASGLLYNGLANAANFQGVCGDMYVVRIEAYSITLTATGIKFKSALSWIFKEAPNGGNCEGHTYLRHQTEGFLRRFAIGSTLTKDQPCYEISAGGFKLLYEGDASTMTIAFRCFFKVKDS